MRLEFINRLTENDVLGKNVLTDDGRVLLKSGVKLTNSYINKLKYLGVLYVYVQDERLDDVNFEDQRLCELKQITMRNMNNIFKNINSNDKVGTKKSFSIVEELISYIIEQGDVNSSLYDIKTYDNFTYVHSLDTCIMSTFMGMSLNFNNGNLIQLGIAGILHDIGKTKINKKIINKRGTLTEEEYKEIKMHPIYGEEILMDKTFVSSEVLRAVSEHHERVDGRGYPYGLVGDQISKYGKILCVCDVYDAVSNDRCYRERLSPNEAYELILSGNDNAFDSQIVEKFKETFSVYALGSCLRLSNGLEGYVIKQNKGFPDRPVLRVLYESQTRKPIPFFELDLLKNIDVTVISVI